jgi:hypothetical protein
MVIKVNISGAGLIAKEIGPTFGGLFLAFPAILTASVTLVEKHERERKLSKGIRGAHLGHRSAGADAAGAAMGSIGLMAFAVVVWQLLPEHSAPLVIAIATVVWAALCLAIWCTWKFNLLHRLRQKLPGTPRLHHG